MGKVGSIVGWLHGGRPTGPPVPPEVDFLHNKMMRGEHRPASKHDAQRESSKHDNLQQSLKVLQQHLEEKKMLKKNDELTSKLHSAKDTLQDLEARNMAMRQLGETLTSRWEDYAEDGLNEIFSKARQAATVEMQAMEAKALDPDAHVDNVNENGERVPITMNMRDVPAAKVGFAVHGLKSICREDQHEVHIYPRYSHLFMKECDLVFDFEEKYPVVRDVMQRQTGTRPAIERGHRLVKVNHKKVETLDYPEIVAELTKRPLMLEFEARPAERAAIEIAIRNQENAFIGGPEKLFAQRKPPAITGLGADFLRDVRRPAYNKYDERRSFRFLRQKTKQVLGE
ncbi:unnamed protein product [Amoebophrya sp. A25]|nr:unnamed protein product [Amoebophrya sp. A25]|eukprot:GSA25T00011962001.1